MPSSTRLTTSMTCLGSRPALTVWARTLPTLLLCGQWPRLTEHQSRLERFRGPRDRADRRHSQFVGKRRQQVDDLATHGGHQHFDLRNIILLESSGSHDRAR